MRSRYRAAAKAVLRFCGIEARRYDHDYRIRNDAFYAQRQLAGGDRAQVVFDVGAHHGQTALRYAAQLPRASIYSFEPSPESFVHLSRAVRDRRQIHPFEIALSDRDGKLTFHVNVDQRTNSALPVSSSAADIGVTMATTQEIEIEARTLDDFCQREKLDCIDILKMDVQGYEAPVLEGAARMLEQQRIRVIYTEVMFAPVYAGQSDLARLQLQLERFGYSLFGLYNVEMRNERPAWCDAIFVPRDGVS